MATVSKYASYHTVITTGYTNPSNAYADDGVYATAAPAKSAQVSAYFGFAGFTTSEIPDGSIINSVTIEFQYKVSTTSSIATQYWQVFNDTTGLGTEQSDASEPTTDTIKTHQVTSGFTLTDLRSNDTVRARLRSARGNSNTAVTFSIDYVKITVDYTPVTLITPTTQTSTFSQPTPTISAVKNVSISAGVQTITFSQPTPNVILATNVNVSADVQTITASQPTATISTATNTIVQPQVQAINSFLPELTVSTIKNVSISADVQTITADNPNVGISTDLDYQAPTETINFSQPSPTIIATKNVFVSPEAQIINTSLFQPDISTQKNTSVSMEVQNFTASSLTLIISAVKNVVVSPNTQTSNFDLPSPKVVINAVIKAGVLDLTTSTNDVLVETVRNVVIASNVIGLKFVALWIGKRKWSDDLVYLDFLPIKETHYQVNDKLVYFIERELAINLFGNYYMKI